MTRVESSGRRASGVSSASVHAAGPQKGHSGAAAVRAAPPEWRIERAIKGVGRVPAAAGRFLDGLARMAVIGRVVRFFSSVWVGIGILFLIGGYIAIGSGFPSVRAHFEMTDLQFFDAWPMRVLLAGLAIDLSVVTLRRIPLTLFKLGSWTVHIGILTLIGGSVWYFSHKQEGSVRIYLNKSVDYCYDVTERALYAMPVKADGTIDQGHPTITPVPSMPIYAEYAAELGNGLDIALPAGAGGRSDVRVAVKGYYPAAEVKMADVRAGEPGETGLGPAIAVDLGRGGQMMETWLIGKIPAKRVLEGNLPLGLEYLYHPDAQRVKDLETSFDGPIGITVRIPKLGIDRTYGVTEEGLGKPIAVEGSRYTITPLGMNGMPMKSKGYEEAFSTTLMVAVSRKGAPGQAPFEYQRMCVSRYPERTPDFIMENGKQVRKQEGVDGDIEIVFHDATMTQGWIVEDESGGLTLIVRTPDGKSKHEPFGEKGSELPMAKGPAMQVKLEQRTDNAVAVMRPLIIPPENRPRSQSVMEVLQLSVAELELSAGNWKREHVYVPFSPYAAIGEEPVGKEPAIVELPGGGKVAFLLATTRRPLPVNVTLKNFEPVKYPGAVHTYEDYISTLELQDRADGGGRAVGQKRTVVTHLNSPASDRGLYYFQAAWDGDEQAPAEKRFSVVGVANRPGVWVMVTGAALMVLGIGFAFYVKPILLKAKKEALARWNAQRLAMGQG